MEILKKHIDKDINMLTIRGIDFDDDNSVKEVLKIIKMLTLGDKYYFEFRREEDDFLSEEETLIHRIEIPKYFQNNGMYEVKVRIDDRRFGSIGCLTINDEIFDYIILFWKYFYGMMFFNPSIILDWDNYSKYFDKTQNKEYGIDLIQNNYADSLFLKGHDGDNLIFVYSSDYEQKNIVDIEEFIKNKE